MTVKLPKKLRHLKPFAYRLRDGDLVTLTQAALISGYSPQHLRKLCDSEKIEHEQRGPRYYFTPRQIEKLFRHVDAQI